MTMLCYDEGIVRDDATVYGNARVRDEAIVRGNAVVRDDALADGHSILEDNAILESNARVLHGTHTKKVQYIKGSDYTATVDGDYINIKNNSFTPDEWLMVIDEWDMDSDKKAEYKGIILFLKNTYMV